MPGHFPTQLFTKWNQNSSFHVNADFKTQNISAAAEC